jgi:carboxymethylenebutenolidase
MAWVAIVGGMAIWSLPVPAEMGTAGRDAALRSAFPAPETAIKVLDATHRHGEWHTVAGKTGTFTAWVVYPIRSEKAAVVVVAAKGEKLTPWLRVVADQFTAEGFITLVPDVLATSDDMETARQYAVSLPASNGKSSIVAFDRLATGGFAAAVTTSPDAAVTRISQVDQKWASVVGLLNRRTGNTPPALIMGTHNHSPIAAVEDHAGHGAQGNAMGVMGAAPREGGEAPPRPRGYPTGKFDHLPPGIFNAKTTLLHTTIRGEWVDIPTPGIGQGRLHTWISYPATTTPTAIIVLMQHGPGMDDWMRGIADQLARQGYIALSPDLHTGLGPNGGNYDSFEGTDAVMRANRLIKDADASYLAVRDYGLKLPGTNGKSVSMGFCRGGRNAYQMAALVPDLTAAVIFYGAAPDEPVLAKINAPVIAFFGEEDVGVASTRPITEAAMKKLGKRFESHLYPHTTHGFLEYQDIAGNEAATEASWVRMSAFLKEHL